MWISSFSRSHFEKKDDDAMRLRSSALIAGKNILGFPFGRKAPLSCNRASTMSCGKLLSYLTVLFLRETDGEKQNRSREHFTNVGGVSGRLQQSDRYIDGSWQLIY